MTMQYKITVNKRDNNRLTLGIIFNDRKKLYVELLGEDEIDDCDGFTDSYLLSKTNMEVWNIMKLIEVRGSIFASHSSKASMIINSWNFGSKISTG